MVHSGDIIQDVWPSRLRTNRMLRMRSDASPSSVLTAVGRASVATPAKPRRASQGCDSVRTNCAVSKRTKTPI